MNSLSAHPSHQLGIIAWELTKRCELACLHCRAQATSSFDSEELTTEEIFLIFRSIAKISRPLIIFSGGDPILRKDLFDIVGGAREFGFKTVLAPTGVNFNSGLVRQLKESGIARVSVSIDGASARSHDLFRGKPGVFNLIMKGISLLREEGIPYQVNTTITNHNVEEVPEIYSLAEEIGAVAWHVFLLVPVGRGEALRGWGISPEKYEEILHWMMAKEKEGNGVEIKVTCAPHYYRILAQNGVVYRNPSGRGCLGGKNFAFISSRGIVQICGYLPVEAGDLRKNQYDFASIWEESPLFLALRNRQNYEGKCGICEFHSICGGCRARAYSFSGNFLGEEPFCSYTPILEKEHKKVDRN